jgi:hypothetical protein
LEKRDGGAGEFVGEAVAAGVGVAAEALCRLDGGGADWPSRSLGASSKRQDDIANRRPAPFSQAEGVVFVGKAQEKCLPGSA